MFLVGILQWWYGSGWLNRFYMTKQRLESSADLFSIGLLASTLFAPFRQISAGNIAGPIGDQLRAFADRSISRLIGSFVRIFMIVVGILVMFSQAFFGILILLLWLIIPILPILGLILMVIGWVPQWTL